MHSGEIMEYFDENQPIGTTIYELPATDEAGEPVTYEITWAYGMADVTHGPAEKNISNVISVSNGSLVATTVFDYETDGVIEDIRGFYLEWYYSVTLKPIGYGGEDQNIVVDFRINDVVEDMKGTNRKDQILGGVGSDRIVGLSGDDRINGWYGDDVIIGGLGRDTMTGAAGNDTFVFKHILESKVSAPDRIVGLAKGDVFDLSYIDANTKVAGNQEFEWIARKSFSGEAGELRYEKTAKGTHIYADVNGDAKADMAIFITKSTYLASGYFDL